MTDNGTPFGFAIRRNGSCLRDIGECTTDAGEFVRCCPTGACVATQTQGCVVRIKKTAYGKSVTQHTAPTEPGIFIKTMTADISVVSRANTGSIGLGRGRLWDRTRSYD